jgi:hypothetical protein
MLAIRGLVDLGVEVNCFSDPMTARAEIPGGFWSRGASGGDRAMRDVRERRRSRSLT